MTTGRRRRRARGQYPEMRRALVMLAAVCLSVRLLCFIGADERLETGVRALAEDPELVTLLLEAGLGPVPTVEEEPSVQEVTEVTPEEPSASLTAADDILGELNISAADTLTDAPEDRPEEEPDPAEFYREANLTIKNYTDYELDPAALLAAPLPFAEGAAVLIVHTHGSEAYTPAGDDIYEESDPARTEDCEYNVVRVGDELAAALEGCGVTVYHDRELYDYPSYAGSYGRSLAAVEAALEQHPDIGIVIDLHRDAMEAADGSALSTVYASPEGESAQVMLVMGTGEDGLAHPDWQTNMGFAAKLQCIMNGMYEGLARPLSVRGERFNQQVCGGAILVEIGMHGNTLQQALTAVRLFADCAAQMLTQ